MTNEDIINYFFNGDNINKNKIKLYNNGNSPKEIYEYLENIYVDSDSLNEKLWRIKLNILIRPICKYCGNKVKHISKGHYRTYCSNTCRNKDLFDINMKKTIDLYGSAFNRNKFKNTINEKFGKDNWCNNKKRKETLNNKSKDEYIDINKKRVKTVNEKYNVDNISQLENIKVKKEQTCLNKYNVKTYLLTDDCKNKNKENYLNNKEIILNKIQNTCLKKYGVKGFNYKKSKQTKLEKYNDENYNNREKYFNTLKNNYNVNGIMKVPYILEKSKQTRINKYGQYNPKHLIEYLKSAEHIDKMFKIMKINNTLNSSKPELESYDLLKQKYPDVIHHYKDNNRYPFCCDFYIPSLDLFIECQYGQFHHHRQYLGTEEDLNDIKILKENAERRHKETGKEKSRYDAELETWSIRDVNKRNIAKQNNLNYIEFWNINELKNWLNNY